MINDSDWSNQSSNAPFHWPVAPYGGEEGKGRVMVEISSTFGTVGVEYLEPVGDLLHPEPIRREDICRDIRLGRQASVSPGTQHAPKH